ncbi:alpha-1A adrenergic receptor [Nematostella vectensis]|uniref:alpha-1A adrenergic receptor n=1 Tax=Nematostella vectensis TaxID=45351 RepID=UPI0013905325|nr:alpha-1A adrenergic receptor [Nematostella vectensis]XP_032225879.1 alpha-1A adrenergic receptor [Nematostella vectensis]XP_032225882.1 alpha-1A adrenergic receptor [Nematostella vectensis]XP_048577750.1 alpha-1A adrenergic receptor [Nematostella vectensis]
MNDAADICQILLTSLMMLLTIFGNAVICLVIYRVRRLHCPTGFLLANLAVTDILIALLLLPFRIPGIIYHRWVFGRPGCVVIGFLQNTLCTASVLTLLSITVDRYLAILWSLQYNGSVTGTKTAICIALLWVYSTISSCFPFFGWGKYSFLPGLWLCETDHIVLPSFTYFRLATVYFLPLFAILFLYSRIIKVAWRHSRQIRLEVQAVNLREASVVTPVDHDTAVGKVSAAAVSGPVCLRKPHSAMKSEIKTALTLAVVVGVLFLFWTPLVFLNLLSFFRGAQVSVVATEVTSYLYYANGLVNPYVYGYLNRLIKHEVIKFYDRLSDWIARLKKKRTRIQPAIIVVSATE